MHSRVIAERDQSAQSKIVTACQSIAERIGIDSELIARLNKKERDPELTSLFQREAVAEVLEIFAASLEVKPEQEQQSGEQNDLSEGGDKNPDTDDHGAGEELEPFNDDTSDDQHGAESEEEPLTLEPEVAHNQTNKPGSHKTTTRRR
jgi:hypothetical protein